MGSREKSLFALLILAQAAHSVEEYTFRLYDVLTPARFLSRLVSNDLARGFAVVNVALVSFALGVALAGDRRLPRKSLSRRSS